jgi:hypothetical protein
LKRARYAGWTLCHGGGALMKRGGITFGVVDEGGE